MDRALRDRVRARAQQRCEYCRIEQSDDEFAFHVEHVIPRKHGGGDREDNLALACQNSNLHKGTNLAGIDPLNGSLTRLFHPRSDTWGEHFRYEEARIVGLTDIGRTTVSVLGINAPERIELRELLGYSDRFA